jgi:DNA replication protein DnaC
MKRQHWPPTPNRITERIAVDRGLTHEQQLEQWLASFKTKNCSWHKGTPLQLDQKESRWQSLPWPVEVKENDPDDWQWYVERHNSDLKSAIADGVYAFTAISRCPACKLQYAGVPPMFYESTFASFQTSTPELSANLERCKEFVRQVDRHHSGFLLMVGLPGNGKTRLACNVLYQVEATDNLYLTQGAMLLEHRKRYGQHVHYRAGRDNDEEKKEKTIQEEAQQTRVLVLDEIGVQPIPSSEMIVFDEVLKHRYDWREPTILISNLPLARHAQSAGLKDFLGDALLDRIYEATGNGKFILQFSGPSFRRSQGEDYLAGT